jgi:endothelin-converting enzyme/putative endopeptidase
LKGNATTKAIRKAYQAYVEQALVLSGLAKAEAAQGAQVVMRIETALAKASLSKVDKRDPKKLWHRTSTKDLARSGAGSFLWADYLSHSGAPAVDWVNVEQPVFLAELARQLKKEPLHSWKQYLRWHLIRAWAPDLSMPFQKAHFDFYLATLKGAKEMEPRWKHCVASTDSSLGEALGRVPAAGNGG